MKVENGDNDFLFVKIKKPNQRFFGCGVFQIEITYFHHYDFLGFDNLNNYLFLKTRTMHIYQCL